MTKKELESKIESNCEKYAKSQGFIFRKFISPSSNGVPDRILMGHGITMFVELKREKHVPRKLQEIVIQEMKDATAVVDVVDNIDDFKKLCQDIIDGKIYNPINDNALQNILNLRAEKNTPT